MMELVFSTVIWSLVHHHHHIHSLLICLLQKKHYYLIIISKEKQDIIQIPFLLFIALTLYSTTKHDVLYH